MRCAHNVYFICVAAYVVLASATVFAEDTATVFPPAGCSASEQRIITWQDGTTSTRCASGQQVLDLALPGCGDEQAVVHEGGKFVC